MVEEFSSLLADQHYVFSVAKARAHGVSYDVIRAALIWCGPGALISHDSAAHLQGLLSQRPPLVHVSMA
jgi:hypothetical protein